MAIINQVVKGSGGGSAPAHYVEKTVDANGVLGNDSSSFIDLTGVTTIGNFALTNAYRDNTQLSGKIDMSSITAISDHGCEYMFYKQDNLPSSPDNSITEIDLSNLQTVGANGLYYIFGHSSQRPNSQLTTVRLNKLKTITGTEALSGAFSSNKLLKNVTLESLETINANKALNLCFSKTGIITMKFSSLSTITSAGTQYFNAPMYGCFLGCTSLQSLWFYALDVNSFGTGDKQFYMLLSSCTNVTVHFPIRIQSTIGSWTDVTNGFSGTNTTVLFDIVTSLTGADGNTYTRQEKDSTSTATAWVYNDTLYYTSGVSNHTAGVNEPAVGDTIYSDSACTTAVTTITAIA